MELVKKYVYLSFEREESEQMQKAGERVRFQK